MTPTSWIELCRSPMSSVGPFDEFEVEEARELVEEARAEAASRAMEDVDPGDYSEDDDARSHDADDSEYIAGIFDGLRE